MISFSKSGDNPDYNLGIYTCYTRGIVPEPWESRPGSAERYHDFTDPSLFSHVENEIAGTHPGIARFMAAKPLGKRCMGLRDFQGSCEEVSLCAMQQEDRPSMISI